MRFLVTKELGRLCKWLRILGLDTRFIESENRSSIIFEAIKESRMIITRDRRLASHHGIKIVLIKSDFLKEQLKQLLGELKLEINPDEMFKRCTICNELLMDVEKSVVKDLVPEYVFQTQQDFVQCPRCKRVYWQGTHWGNVQKILDKIIR